MTWALLFCLLATPQEADQGPQVKMTLTMARTSFAVSETVVAVLEIEATSPHGAILNPFVVPAPYGVLVYDGAGRRLEARHGLIIEFRWRDCHYAMFRSGTRITLQIPLNGDDAEWYLGRFDLAPGTYCAEIVYDAAPFIEFPVANCAPLYRHPAFVRYAKSNRACFQIVAGAPK